MIARILLKLLGREAVWRLGRSLYMTARGDVANDMRTNGEWLLIRSVVAAKAKSAGTEPLRIWDVGANLGHWSGEAVDAAANLSVPLELHSFEPVPTTRKALTERFAERSNVTINGVALAGQSGTARMLIVSEFGGTNALATDQDVDGNFIDVEVTTGDQFAAGLGWDHIDLIKVDTEGHDLSVLTGLSDMLRQGRVGVVQFEYNHRWLANSASLQKVFALAQDWPYHIARVSSGGLEIMDSWNPEIDRFFECNYALVSHDLAKALPTRFGHWNASNILTFS